MNLKSQLNFILFFLCVCFILGCNGSGEGLYPAEPAKTYILWQNSFKGQYPEKPFPNNIFLNENGHMELALSGEYTTLGTDLLATRYFGPQSIIYIPFSGEITADYLKFDGSSLSPIQIINANSASKKFGQRIPFSVSNASTAKELFIIPDYSMEQTSNYAVVIFKNLYDAGGEIVGSPFEWINFSDQNDQLRPLFDKKIIDFSKVSFCWTFKVREVSADLKAIRHGLYGRGGLGSLENHQLARLVIDKMEITADADSDVPAYIINGLLDSSSDLVDILGDYYGKEVLPMSPYLALAHSMIIPYYIVVPKFCLQESCGFGVVVMDENSNLEMAKNSYWQQIKAAKQALVFIKLQSDTPDKTTSLLKLRNQWWQQSYHQMQLVRTLNKINCRDNLYYDHNNDGLPEIAGDFDGDGFCELSGQKDIYFYVSGPAAQITYMTAKVEPLIAKIVSDPPYRWVDWYEINGFELSMPLYNRQILDDFEAVLF